ncbi:hypothetical protein Daudx_1513 [Candidatus Desulforudis audaxviator]|nr:hypothetical protein Daudx_1513 [Candidatus Desulforudis audaxviator]
MTARGVLAFKLVKYIECELWKGGMPMRITEIILLVAVVAAFFWIMRNFGGG